MGGDSRRKKATTPAIRGLTPLGEENIDAIYWVAKGIGRDVEENSRLIF